jgi:hypothetical protein
MIIHEKNQSNIFNIMIEVYEHIKKYETFFFKL